MRKQKSASADKNGVTESLRPLRRQVSRCDTPATNIIDSYVTQSRSIETRSSREELVCLAKVAVMIATHELLLSQLLSLRRQSWSSVSKTTRAEAVGNMISTTIGQVVSAFKRATRSVQARIARSRGLEGQLLGWKMAYFDDWHYHLMNTESLSDPQAYLSARNHRAACMPLDATETRILSCTSAIFHDTHMGFQMQSERPHLDEKDYLGLEAHIKKLFLEIEDIDADGVTPARNPRVEKPSLQEYNFFPASHIAYFNHDRAIAFQLFKQLSDHNSSVDIVKRSLVHVVAASQDLETISKITKHAPGAVEHAGRDQLGLYPMDLLSGPDSQAIRMLLHDVGAKTISDTRGMLARLETQNCSSFASRLRNNEISTGTHANALQDLDFMHFDPLEIQMVNSTSTGNSMSFFQCPTMDPNPIYGNYAMHGQGNIFQSVQSFDNQVQYSLQNTAFIPSGSQFIPTHHYNAFYHNG